MTTILCIQHYRVNRLLFSTYMGDYRSGIRQIQADLLKYPIIQVGDADCKYDTRLVQPIVASIYNDVEQQYQQGLQKLYARMQDPEQTGPEKRNSILDDLLLEKLKNSRMHTTISQDLSIVKETTVAMRLMEIKKRDQRTRESAAWKMHQLNNLDGTPAEREIRMLQQLSENTTAFANKKQKEDKAKSESNIRKSKIVDCSKQLEHYRNSLRQQGRLDSH